MNNLKYTNIRNAKFIRLGEHQYLFHFKYYIGDKY